MTNIINQKSKALITVSKNRNGNDKNNILILKNKILKYSKENIQTFNPNYIDWGFYIFNKQLLQKFKYSLNNFEELINTLIKKDELVHYKTRSEYIQINTKKKILCMLKTK